MKSMIYLVFLEVALLLLPQNAYAAGTLEDYRFFSKALNREMVCRVYLPDEYEPGNPERRFPVIYFLHGSSLGYDQYDPLFLILEDLIAVKLIKPVILILPDGLAPPYNGSFYTNSALYGNFEDYICNDLISFTDSAFYTLNERGKRAIMGASMGSYGALKIAFKHQELFIGVAGHSGPVNINLMDIFIPDLIAEDGGTAPYHWSPGPGKSLTNLTFTMAGAFSPNLNNEYLTDFPLDSMAQPKAEVMQRWKTENVCEIARIYRPGANLAITFDCGDLDEYYLYYQNRSLADTLTKYNIPFKYEEYTGTHTSGLPVRVILSFTGFNKLFQANDASLASLQTGMNWKIFPNPASNTLNVFNSHTQPSPGKQFIQMADVTGRLVLHQTLTENQNNIDISDLPEGLYFIKIPSGSTIQTAKTFIAR